MDPLRWILLLIGAVIIAGIYFVGRRGRQNSEDAVAEDTVAYEEPAPELDAPEPDEEPEILERELAGLGNLIAEDERDAPPAAETPAVAERPAAQRMPTPARPARAHAAPEPAPAPVDEKIIVLHVMAHAGDPFAGPDILRAAQAAGMVHGNMRIFHRLADADDADSAIYSMANMVEPGSFDLTALSDLQSPGLSLFLQLPGPVEGPAAFDEMLAGATRIAEVLGGELRDQTRSVLSKQTIEYIRGEIRDHQRKSQLAYRRS